MKQQHLTDLTALDQSGGLYRRAFRDAGCAAWRAFLARVIEESGYTVPEHRTFADDLAAAYAHRPPSDPLARAAAEQALVAFIAGWEVGHRDGFYAGKEVALEEGA